MRVAPALVERIRTEFLEMPGLKLAQAQACRLWCLNESECGEALDSLIADGFLYRTPSGAFILLPSAGSMLKAGFPETERSLRCPHCRHLNSVPVAHRRTQSASISIRCTACFKLITVAAA